MTKDEAALRIENMLMLSDFSEPIYEALRIALHELRGPARCTHAWTKTCLRCVVYSEGGRIIKEDNDHAIVEYSEQQRKEYVNKANGWNER